MPKSLNAYYPFALVAALQAVIGIFAYAHLDIDLWDDTAYYLYPARWASWRQLHQLPVNFSPLYLVFAKLQTLVVHNPIIWFYVNHSLLMLLAVWSVQALVLRVYKQPSVAAWLGVVVSLGSFLGQTIPHGYLATVPVVAAFAYLLYKQRSFGPLHVLLAQVLWLLRPEFALVFALAAVAWVAQLIMQLSRRYKRQASYRLAIISYKSLMYAVPILVLLLAFGLPFQQSDGGRSLMFVKQSFLGSAQLLGLATAPDIAACTTPWACLQPHLQQIPLHIASNMLVYVQALGCQFLYCLLPLGQVLGYGLLPAALGWLVGLWLLFKLIKTYLLRWAAVRAFVAKNALALVVVGSILAVHVGVSFLVKPRLHYMQLNLAWYCLAAAYIPVLISGTKPFFKALLGWCSLGVVVVASGLLVLAPQLFTGPIGWQIADSAPYLQNPPLRDFIQAIHTRQAQQAGPATVYGTNNRLELYLPANTHYIDVAADTCRLMLTNGQLAQPAIAISLDPNATPVWAKALHVPTDSVSVALQKMGYRPAGNPNFLVK